MGRGIDGSTTMKTNAILAGAAAAAVFALSTPAQAGILGGGFGGGLGGGFGGGGLGGAASGGADGAMRSGFATPRFGQLDRGFSNEQRVATHRAQAAGNTAGRDARNGANAARNTAGATQGSMTSAGNAGITGTERPTREVSSSGARAPRSDGAARRGSSAPSGNPANRSFPKLMAQGSASDSGNVGGQQSRSNPDSSRQANRASAFNGGYAADTGYSVNAGRHPSAAASGSAEGSMSASESR